MADKIGIVYFSGTKNTEFISQSIKNVLEKWDEKVDLINIEKDKIIPTDYKYLIIGGPVYIDRYPDILIKYAKQNLKDYKNKCMLFTTQASEKDSTAYQHFINEMHNLSVTYCMYVPMPNNVYNFFFKKTLEEKQDEMIKNSIGIIENGLKEFRGGKIKLYPRNKITVFMINLVYKMVYPRFISLINKKINIDRDKCIDCRLCEKSCPAGCIKIDNGVSHTKECIFCQRCLNICPKNAFLYKDKEISQYKPRFKELEKSEQ